MAIDEPNVQVKTRKYSRWLRHLRCYFLEYCTNTSIHGFKYLGERRSTIEKLWWALCITISLYHCTMLIIQTYQKWERSPVIVTFSTNEMPIWDIPFPAVTICPLTKSIKSKFNFTEMALLKNNSEINEQSKLKFKYYEYMSLLCSSNLHFFNEDNANWTIDTNAINFFIKVQPNFTHTIRNCMWAGQPCPDDRSEMFKPVITSDGVCYTFNMLDRDEIFTDNVVKDYQEEFSVSPQPTSEWSAENGYNKNSSLTSFPYRTIVPGRSGGLSLVLLTINEDLDYICGDALQGYNVMLHQPGQVPIPRLDLYRVGLNEDVVISVKPNVMKTSNDIKGYNFKERNCFLPGEKKLTFFKIYNQQNCLYECLSKFTKNYCHCVGFFMPRFNNTKICGPAADECVAKSCAKFLTKEISFKINHPNEKNFRNVSEDDIYKDCNCLPSCESLTFDAEVSQSSWDWFKGMDIMLPDNDTHKYHLTKLKIYFKDMQFTTSQRGELYGNASFIANCGGLLGLFTGFSILSLVEVIYFCTLRLAFNCRKLGRRHWSGQNNVSSSSDSDE